MRLVQIPKDKYEEYRIRLMFDCYKWDPQFLDHNTIAEYALLITQEEYRELADLTEALDRETRKAEEYLNCHLEDTAPLYLTRKLKHEVSHMRSYDREKHIRLMRYDFHPTVEGSWAVSEVNSDVPGGFSEGSLMPQAALEALGEPGYGFISFGEQLCGELKRKVPSHARIALVHCTCYSDDRQVMQYIGDKLQSDGFTVLYMAADQLQFRDGRAYSILDGKEGEVDAIIRFSPLEWIADMKTEGWHGYFDTITPSCNHPIAIYAQSKRFPFVWDKLEKNGISMRVWRELLPETVGVREGRKKEGYIYKPVYGRVGENISIRESCTPEEYRSIMREVRWLPKTYVAQKRFQSRPLLGADQKEYHVCIGSYTVDEKHAGFYARISDTPRIDSNAADIPVLIEDEKAACTCSIERGSKLGRETYRIWAPYQKKWTQWVRPVPFVKMHTAAETYCLQQLSVPDVPKLDIMGKHTALIVDLFGEDSVEMGLAQLKNGYRPIPIYNGVKEQAGTRAVTNNHLSEEALLLGAEYLRNTEISEDAPPAFLTDTNRLQRYKMNEGIFDNSWDVYPQDLPSGKYLVSQDIRHVLVIGRKIAGDLRKILRTYRKAGIDIYISDGYTKEKRVKIL